jgi:hypothetical protein
MNDLLGAPNTIQLILRGAKRYRLPRAQR